MTESNVVRSINDRADFWCYTIGVNSASVDTKNKVTVNSFDANNGNQEHWTIGYITDQLYLEMCTKEIEDPQYNVKISKYYLEAAKYAGRISAGDFSNTDTDGPVFLLDSKDFSPRLTAELVELYCTAKESLHNVVKEAVFKIFKARHERIFYQYIQSSRFRWRFI